ncbi:cyclodeaminase/cyclohydrolase family protein [Modicisalibacter tunisiensis]|uniref:Cyclodeaminase/cyclohydrolase family protein n=1 Tax=Modicisalibacter tunisiensis TaxID=390637 RepID=A0ABS7WYL8_9GAMM|nr:cyclodeaminase/cyclohydrolase family protein [Modicisalibacter tunisiensis]MBZ9567715.1 cyclodeaminase/cyclohydrolase family protein [Modicisalibacter tunisiensis]
MTASNSLWDMTLAGFRDAIESRSTPGCGAAAAASAGLGLALVLKGLRITRGKQDDAPDTMQRAIERADALLTRLGDYADEDVNAFEAYLAAVRLPHDDEVQGERRERAIARAAERANAVPLGAARACREGLALSVEALALTDANLQSDTRAGALMLHSGLSALLLGVDANLASLDDDDEREALARARDGLQDAADRCRDDLLRQDAR